MKTASIYKRLNNGYIIFNLSKTTAGLLIASEPYIVISEDKVTTDVLANSIKAALCNDHSKTIPNPINWVEFNKIFLRKIGFKSTKDLENPATKYVLITENEDKIVFMPTRLVEKPNKGFLHQSENETVVISTNASNQEIATGYELALSRCG